MEGFKKSHLFGERREIGRAMGEGVLAVSTPVRINPIGLKVLRHLINCGTLGVKKSFGLGFPEPLQDAAARKLRTTQTSKSAIAPRCAPTGPCSIKNRGLDSVSLG